MRVINFTNKRFYMFGLSLLLIIAGIGVTISRGGFNLGIDFNAGLNQRVQVAPVAAAASYSGEADVVLQVTGSSVVVTTTEGSRASDEVFSFEEYPTLGDLRTALASVPGLVLQTRISDSVASESLAGFSYPVDLNEGAALINYVDAGNQSPVAIEDVREILGELDPQIQVVGNPAEQEFIIRVQDNGEDANFSTTAAARITELLADAYGADEILVKQTDYVGARFSGELGSQTISLSILALLLILIYIWIRFRLAFAVSAITALVHDVLIMLGFIGAFQMEVVTATIAAVLTIIGYSLNDTIVVFDRIRENQRLMRESEFTGVINTSITQSLSRTIITSLTTLLAVIALAVFGTGPIRDFAIAMIVGVIVGTYSSIFIASPVLLGWTNVARKRKQAKDTEKYGVKAAPKAESDTKKTSEVKPSVEIPSAERKLKGKRRKK